MLRPFDFAQDLSMADRYMILLRQAQHDNISFNMGVIRVISAYTSTGCKASTAVNKKLGRICA